MSQNIEDSLTLESQNRVGEGGQRLDDASEGQGEAGSNPDPNSDPIDVCIPADRRRLLEVLRADGEHGEVVETFVRPMLRTLAVPPGRDGATYLRMLRDEAAKVTGASAAALARTCRGFEAERVRDLPWPKDVKPAVEAAVASLLITLQPGDPRWAAWLHHDRMLAGKSAYAAHVARNRTAYAVTAEWPPASAEVEETPGIGLWTIPWGTAEHAAWLAHWRRQGRPGIDKAQAADVAKRRLSEKSRWPVVATETNRFARTDAPPASGDNNAHL